MWEEIVEACIEDEPMRRAERFESLAQRLRDRVTTNDDGDTWYTLGYVLYKHPERIRSPQLQDETERALQTAVERDPGHALAWMYLGYNAYDLGRHDVARRSFERAEPKQLMSNFA